MTAIFIRHFHSEGVAPYKAPMLEGGRGGVSGGKLGVASPLYDR
jgi:hypothetical protein